MGAMLMLGASLLDAAPQTGWWWNPNEAGRGFFLEVQGPRMFMAGYFYSEDGRATWLASNDPMPDPNFYQGRLLAFGNGQALLGQYRPPGAAVDAGGVTIRFTDDIHGTLTWPGGSIPIERYRYQRGGSAAFQPFTGWWWNPAESGRGFSIEMQGDHMFIGTYMYDANGNPIWYVGDAFMETPTRFRSSLLQFGNGQTLTGAYRSPTPPAVVGSLTVDFSSADRATVTFSDAKSAGKASATVGIAPFYVAATPQGRSPDFWNGHVDFRATAYIGPAAYRYTVTVTVMNWEKQFGDDPNLATLIQYPAKYRIGGILADIRVRQDTPFCFADVMAPLDRLQGELTLQANGSYASRIFQTVAVPTTLRCDFPDGDYSEENVIARYEVDLRMDGTLAGGVMTGVFPPSETPEFTFEGAWSFRSANR